LHHFAPRGVLGFGHGAPSEIASLAEGWSPRLQVPALTLGVAETRAIPNVKVRGHSLKRCMIVSMQFKLCSLIVVAGCAWAATYSKDVAPILNRRCVECHRAGEVAPMALTSYESVRPWAKAIREKAVTRTMPPWTADPNIGEFQNDRRLAQS